MLLGLFTSISEKGFFLQPYLQPYAVIFSILVTWDNGLISGRSHFLSSWFLLAIGGIKHWRQPTNHLLFVISENLPGTICNKSDFCCKSLTFQISFMIYALYYFMLQNRKNTKTTNPSALLSSSARKQK